MSEIVPWVNKRGRIQLRANRKYGVSHIFLRIEVRERAQHAGTPPSDKWQLLGTYKVTDVDVPLRDLAQGYMRLHAALLGHKYEGTCDV